MSNIYPMDIIYNPGQSRYLIRKGIIPARNVVNAAYSLNYAQRDTGHDTGYKDDVKSYIDEWVIFPVSEFVAMKKFSFRPLEIFSKPL